MTKMQLEAKDQILLHQLGVLTVILFHPTQVPKNLLIPKMTGSTFFLLFLFLIL